MPRHDSNCTYLKTMTRAWRLKNGIHYFIRTDSFSVTPAFVYAHTHALNTVVSYFSVGEFTASNECVYIWLSIWYCRPWWKILKSNESLHICLGTTKQKQYLLTTLHYKLICFVNSLPVCLSSSQQQHFPTGTFVFKLFPLLPHCYLNMLAGMSLFFHETIWLA